MLCTLNRQKEHNVVEALEDVLKHLKALDLDLEAALKPLKKLT